MVKVGITGGIGSGKTTVCNIFQQHGAYILNADDLAKSLMSEDEMVKKEIIETFGEESYTKEGRLNRHYLADQAFGNGRVQELNDIVHPRMPEAVEKQMKIAAGKGYRLFVYEAALLLQNLRPDDLDFVILVLADKEKRINRVRKRDELTKELILDRMQHQKDFNELTHLADIVIKNNGTLKELKDQAERVYYDILMPQ